MKFESIFGDDFSRCSSSRLVICTQHSRRWLRARGSWRSTATTSALSTRAGTFYCSKSSQIQILMWKMQSASIICGMSGIILAGQSSRGRGSPGMWESSSWTCPPTARSPLKPATMLLRHSGKTGSPIWLGISLNQNLWPNFWKRGEINLHSLIELELTLIWFIFNYIFLLISV